MPTAKVTQARQTILTLVDGATSASLSSGSSLLTGAFNPSATPDQEMYLALNTGFGGTPAADQLITVYLVKCFDTTGTTFEDGDATTPPKVPIWTFTTLAANTLKQISEVPIRIPPTHYKLVIKNSSGQTMSANWSLLGIPVDQQATW